MPIRVLHSPEDVFANADLGILVPRIGHPGSLDEEREHLGRFREDRAALGRPQVAPGIPSASPLADCQKGY
jgi:hypothetical protein